MNILLLEPDVKLGQIYHTALTQAGYEVRLAAHAQDAVHAADAAVPDVILLEVQLAAHNGIEFLYELRSYPEWQAIPVVLITMVPPHSLMITREVMHSLGIANILYKPATNLQQLLHAVSEAV